MKNTHRYLKLVALILTCPAFAAPPATINLHGQLLSSTGTPVSGSRAYTVQFHDAGTGGSTIGSALTGTVDVSADGLFNLEVTPPAGILTASEVWYSLGVDTDEPADSSAADDVFPSRIRVHSVPFALQANEVVAVDAVRIGNGSVDNTEFGALDGVTGNIQTQIDAIDATGIAADISQLETDVAAKANSTDVYTKTEMDTTVTGLETDIAAKANSTDVYTKTEVDTTVTGLETDISAKANSTDVYTKTEVDTTVTGLETDISAKANSTDVYTKTEMDTTVTGLETDISAKANSTDVYTKTEVNTTVTGLETDISAKANSTDVYTKTESNSNFVDIGGDTMTGALAVDTVNEATATAGVVIDGVRLKDNFVELTTIAAPGVTANRLYNTGGNLFWNGTQLDAGGGGADTDSMHWTGYIYDFGSALSVFSQVMLKSGTITSFQLHCGGAANNTTVDLKKNGTSILTSAPAAFVDDSLQTPSVADTGFLIGDVLEFEVDGTTADVKAVSITLVVEY